MASSEAEKERRKKIKNNRYMREHLDAVDELPRRVRHTMFMLGQIDVRYDALCTLIDYDIGIMARMRRNWMRNHGFDDPMSDYLSDEEEESDGEDEEPADGPRASKRQKLSSSEPRLTKKQKQKAEETQVKKESPKKPPKKLTKKEQQQLKKEERERGKKREEENVHTDDADADAEDDDNEVADVDPADWRTEEVKELEARIKKHIDLAKRMADLKIELAEHTYDRIDVSIRRMDTDLKRMEADLRRQGRDPPPELPKPGTSPRRRRRGGGAAKSEEPEEQKTEAASLERDDLPVDPNEPVYCICMQVSYGEMVGCDNPECEHGEWFHFPCVKLHRRPPGRWLCPGCTAEQRENRAKARSAAKRNNTS